LRVMVLIKSLAREEISTFPESLLKLINLENSSKVIKMHSQTSFFLLEPGFPKHGLITDGCLKKLIVELVPEEFLDSLSDCFY